MTLFLALLAGLLLTAAMLIHAYFSTWGYNIRFSMPGGLLKALSRDASHREGPFTAVIMDHEHYEAVSIKPWGAVIWNTVADEATRFEEPSRSFTIVPYGTAAYNLLALHVRYPFTAAGMAHRLS